ncbi:MAG: hypothetical protein LH631_08805 [Alkalinema sp. CAN_BIN05]|nr:hypothetical protein [Alkalinema sp. CAN_BIN05]
MINGKYVPIVNSTSTALGLRLEVTGALISFYRSDNGEKLLIPAELQEKAEQEQEKLKLEQARSQELEMRLEAQSEEFRSQAEALQAQLDRYRDRFGEL